MRKRSFFGAALMMLASLFGQAQHSGIVLQESSKTSKQDAVLPVAKVARPVSVKNKAGGFSGEPNPNKHHKKGFRNQRQLRKHLRSNPHLRKKYGK